MDGESGGAVMDGRSGDRKYDLEERTSKFGEAVIAFGRKPRN